MTNQNKTSVKIEENFYQVLGVPNAASLSDIRKAYEVKLEETHLEAFAAYSLFDEEETEEKLLQFSHAYITLANPIARAKYDDELNQVDIAKKKTDLRDKNVRRTKDITINILRKIYLRKMQKIQKKRKVVAGQTLKERQDYYLKLSAKNEKSTNSIQEYYDTPKNRWK